MVRKYLDPFIVFIENGPHISQWIISNGDFVQETLTGNESLRCFALGQTVQVLLECRGTFGSKGFNRSNLDWDGWPSL